MQELEWSQDFPHYNPMGAICCPGNHSSASILPKPIAVNPLTQWCSIWNLILIGKLVLEIFMFESGDALMDGQTDAGSSPIL